jgi:glucose/arabinose dehydrogenase
LYVDGDRRVVEGETCASVSASTFDCSAALPSLTAGVHTLELATFVMNGDTVVESTRSTALRVTVAGLVTNSTPALTPPGDAPAEQGGPLVSSDGLRLRADILARDLSEPVDVAGAADGRVFVAERGGRIRVFDPASTVEETRRDNELRLPGDRGETRLTSLAIDPDFGRTGAVHVAYITAERDGAVLRIARFRERGGVLGEAAVTSSHAVPEDASAIVRFGPDGRLYVGIGTSTAPDDAQNLAAAGGKVLRLNADGTTPDDNPWSSPVFSAGHRDPRGLAWNPRTGTLWEVERDEPGDEVNAIRPGSNYGWPRASGATDGPRVTLPIAILPRGIEASGAATITAATSPLFGDLLVSAFAGEDLLRVRMGAGSRQGQPARLLQGRFGRIGQVTTTGEGVVYVTTANTETSGAGRDLLIRLTVADQ